MQPGHLVEKKTARALSNLEHFLTQRNCPQPYLAGTQTILGQMPDWNLVELIGVNPRLLSVSLFSTLITRRVWQQARIFMGYRPVPREPLMVVLAGRPYFDVRNSFNSFLPAGLPRALEETIVDAWLSRLRSHPQFHDKVEFEVAETILDFSFESCQQTKYQGVFTNKELALYRKQPGDLTRANVALGSGTSLSRALRSIRIWSFGMTEISTIPFNAK